ncbi:MAG: hypothetical protein K6E68_06300 [Lachnospiraceae bacterium]|nr:hypothetical protein [Lachnospiraceae bacterium]
MPIIRCVNKNRKKLIKAVVFLLVIAALVLAKDQLSEYLMTDLNYGMPALTAKGSIDRLFIGSSAFRQGLDINTLEESEEDSYILTYNGNQPCTEYLQLKKLIGNGVKIHELYVDMYAFTSSRVPALEDKKMLLELNTSEKRELYDTISNKDFMTFWEMFVTANNEQLLTWPVSERIVNSQFKNGGTLISSAGLTEEAYGRLSQVYTSEEIDENQKKAIEDIINLCNDNDINLTFVEIPKADVIMQSDVYNDIMNEYIELLDGRKVKYIRSPEGLMGYSDFSDGIHLSSEGRTKYTKWLIEKIDP